MVALGEWLLSRQRRWAEWRVDRLWVAAALVALVAWLPELWRASGAVRFFVETARMPLAWIEREYGSSFAAYVAVDDLVAKSILYAGYLVTVLLLAPLWRRIRRMGLAQDADAATDDSAGRSHAVAEASRGEAELRALVAWVLRRNRTGARWYLDWVFLGLGIVLCGIVLVRLGRLWLADPAAIRVYLEVAGAPLAVVAERHGTELATFVAGERILAKAFLGVMLGLFAWSRARLWRRVRRVVAARGLTAP